MKIDWLSKLQHMLQVLAFALAIATICVTLAACARDQAPPYDLVVANGRVLDPESGLDAVRHVGIRGGKIQAVSEAPLTGVRVIDAGKLGSGS